MGRAFVEHNTLKKQRGEKYYFIWGLFPTQPTSIKQESNGVEINRLPITVRIHKLPKLSTAFDSEEDFIPILHDKVEHNTPGSTVNYIISDVFSSKYNRYKIQ